MPDHPLPRTARPSPLSSLLMACLRDNSSRSIERPSTHLLLPLLLIGLVLSGISQCESDADGDGWTVDEGDCDDTNADIHPGAEELCNGIDDDCDRRIDEDATATWYEDADGDGYGNPDSPLEACPQPEGYADNADDCDDGDALVSTCFQFGDGRDGNLSVDTSWNLNEHISAGRSWPDGVAWQVIGESIAQEVILESTAGLATGDQVLLIALQGSEDTVGAWEVFELESVGSSSVTFTEAPTAALGTPTGSLILLQRIPQYQSVTVTGTIGATPWDGLETGAEDGRSTGIVAMKVFGSLGVSGGGSISTDKAGFRGGNGSPPEGPAGYSASGGGTGSSGGWADGGAGAGAPGEASGGAGASSCSNAGGAAGLGGGGGGGKITHCAGGSPVTGGGGGGGGASYDSLGNWSSEELSLLSMGSGGTAGAGGGASGANDSSTATAPGGEPTGGSAGESGGGLLLIWAHDITLEGAIRANGGVGGSGGTGESTNGGGSDDGGGGGGEGGQGASGGTILLASVSLNASEDSILVYGGSGGSGGVGGGGYASGGGGGGSGAAFGASPTSGADGVYAGDGGAPGGGGAGGEAGPAGVVRIVTDQVNGIEMADSTAEEALLGITDGLLSSWDAWSP